MKLSAKTKKILKIATLSALALLEIYLIYASVASINTYHRHPRFISDDGQIAQSSGYRTQFYVCVAFAVIIPLLMGFASYMFWFRKAGSEMREVKPAVTASAVGMKAAAVDGALCDSGAAPVSDNAAMRMDAEDRDITTAITN